MKLDGDDAVELFLTPEKYFPNTVVDTFGQPNGAALKSTWLYTKGYGYRKDESGPDGTKFVQANWIMGANVLEDKKKNGGAKRFGGAFPVGTYCRKKPCVRLTTTTTSTTTTTTSKIRETTSSSTTTSTTTTTAAGCTNKLACNYNKDAKGDDGSCNLPKECFDCKNNCICKKDECGVCGGKGPGSDMKNCKDKKGQLSWVGDKTCDDFNNICACGWDKGDCCMDKDKNPATFKFCTQCKCRDPKVEKVVKKGDCGICEGKCAKSSLKGDKYCDDSNNNCGCNWDGGDCCGTANNYKYCKDCKCLDCKFEHETDECTKQIKGKCGQKKWKGDKNCDDENNNAGCDWDGGDCCGANNYDFCKECKCLDCTFVSKGDNCIAAIKGACGAKDYVGDKYCDDNK